MSRDERSGRASTRNRWPCSLTIHQWRDKESTRAAVKNEIRNFLWSESTGLPAPAYSDTDVEAKTEVLFQHIHYAYPQLPSPVYGERAA